MDKAAVDLTEQERAIISLIAQGETIKCIGQTITMTPYDVLRQIHSCRRKLDARNNAELVANAISWGANCD